jgi:hypothetical protein
MMALPGPDGAAGKAQVGLALGLDLREDTSGAVVEFRTAEQDCLASWICQWSGVGDVMSWIS